MNNCTNFYAKPTLENIVADVLEECRQGRKKYVVIVGGDPETALRIARAFNGSGVFVTFRDKHLLGANNDVNLTFGELKTSPIYYIEAGKMVIDDSNTFHLKY